MARADLARNLKPGCLRNLAPRRGVRYAEVQAEQLTQQVIDGFDHELDDRGGRVERPRVDALGVVVPIEELLVEVHDRIIAAVPRAEV